MKLLKYSGGLDCPSGSPNNNRNKMTMNSKYINIIMGVRSDEGQLNGNEASKG
ncbi:MAG: hypothetical protein HDS37_00835 [Bacteroides sp.]|nr:hypothetical protein [Bacteroides sp.]